MSKAILVIDMPKDCPMCPVAHYNKLDEFTGCDIVGGKRYAMTTEEGYKDTNYRPAWCPLKPIPTRRDINVQKLVQQCCAIGFNACLEQLIEEDDGLEQT